jgi:hypothetical protein
VKTHGTVVYHTFPSDHPKAGQKCGCISDDMSWHAMCPEHGDEWRAKHAEVLYSGVDRGVTPVVKTTTPS